MVTLKSVALCWYVFCCAFDAYTDTSLMKPLDMSLMDELKTDNSKSCYCDCHVVPCVVEVFFFTIAN